MSGNENDMRNRKLYCSKRVLLMSGHVVRVGNGRTLQDLLSGRIHIDWAHRAIKRVPKDIGNTHIKLVGGSKRYVPVFCV